MKAFARSANKPKSNPINHLVVLSMLPVAAIFYALVTGATTHALSLPLVGEPTELLRDTVRTILPRSNTTSPSQTPSGSTPSSNSSSGEVNNGGVPTNASTTQRTSTNTAAQPVEPVHSAIRIRDSEEFSKQPLLRLFAPYLSPASMRNDSSGPVFFASTSTSRPSTYLLEPSEGGWKILGMHWYWWLLGAAIVSVTSRYIFTTFQTRSRFVHE